MVAIFFVYGIIFENFQYFGKKSRYYEGDLKNGNKNSKPIKIALSEGRFFLIVP